MSYTRFAGLGAALVALVFLSNIDRSRATDKLCDHALASGGRYRVMVGAAPDGTPALSFAGALHFEPHFAHRFHEALIQLPREGRVILALDGIGGSFAAHRALASEINHHLRRHIFRRSRNARIVTYVPANAVCVGDCLRLFMLGDERLAHPTARFGFRRAIGLGRVGHTVRELREWGLRGPLLNRMRRAGAFDDPKRVDLTPVGDVTDSNLLTGPPVDLGISKL